MAVGVYSIRSAMARMVVASYPWRTNISRAASRMRCRVSARSRERRSRLPMVDPRRVNHGLKVNRVRLAVKRPLPESQDLDQSAVARFPLDRESRPIVVGCRQSLTLAAETRGRDSFVF